MKAKLKDTGEIVEVLYSHTTQNKGCDVTWYISIPNKANFTEDKLEFIDNGESLDYWTKLEHQAAIAVMGCIVGNSEFAGMTWTRLSEYVIAAAQHLVEKLKEKEENKWK